MCHELGEVNILLVATGHMWEINVYFTCFKKNVYLFYREREREQGRGRERGREGGRERIPSRLYAVSTEPDAGFRLPNHEIMTRAEIKSWMLNRPSRPGAAREPKFLTSPLQLR